MPGCASRRALVLDCELAADPLRCTVVDEVDENGETFEVRFERKG